MADVTFRDFGGAVMAGDVDEAGNVLGELLGVAPAQALAAAKHFLAQMSAVGPTFMMKAMGLRTAVTSGTDAEIHALLGECFGLDEATSTAATAALRTRYPA